jgi:tellurite resistance protein
MRRLIDDLLLHFPAGDEGLIALVDLAVLVAVADGVIDPAERQALSQSIEALIGGQVPESMVEHLVSESCAQIQALGPEAAAHSVGTVLAARGAAAEGVRLGLAIARVSEGMSAIELQRVREVARAAGLDAAELDAIVAATA